MLWTQKFLNKCKKTIILEETGWNIIFYKLNVSDRITGNDGELLV